MKLAVKPLCFLVAALFIATIAMAQQACPFLACHGPEGDGWMLPLLLAPFGIPALIASLVFAGKAIFAAKPGR